LDGSGLNAGRLLRRLRDLSQLNFLFEAGPGGEYPNFKLTATQAELRPPGRYAFRDLLDTLAQVAGARWEFRWGVVVLSPDPKARKAE